MKKTKINSKTFLKEVTDYQNRIFYSNRGQCLQAAGLELGIELTAEQISYIHAVMVVSDNNLIGYGMGFVSIPVGLLFTMITPFNIKCYDSNSKVAQSYMSGVTDRCIIPLKDIILFKGKYIGKCRKFAILKEFIKHYYMAQYINFESGILDTTDDWDFFKPAKKGYGFENLSRLNPLTVQSVEKAKHSKFVFDTELYTNSKEFIKDKLTVIKTGKINMDALDSLSNTLSFIYRKDSKPQYPTSYHLQDSGRVHTIGGCIQLPKWFRSKFIKGINRDSVKVEFDLKCAQLLILCELLNQPKLKEKILTILENEGSIWNSIGSKNNTIDKRIKKIIVYGFSFGAELSKIPFLATREAKKLNIEYAVTKKTVTECLTGLLNPLVKAREEWLTNYKTISIIKNKESQIVENALGYKFHVTKQAIEFYHQSTDSKKANSTKIGSQLLAFLCQGQEQYYIQHLIANHVEDNILMWNYDGFVLELSPSKINSVINHLLSNSLAPLEYEILTD